MSLGASKVDYLPDFFPKILKTFTKMTFFTFFFGGGDFSPHFDPKFGPNIPKVVVFPHESYCMFLSCHVRVSE